MQCFLPSDVVRALLAAGANTGAAADKGWTALMTASAEGHGDIVDELVGVGADVDARNEQGCTALIMAAHNGYAGEWKNRRPLWLPKTPMTLRLSRRMCTNFRGLEGFCGGCAAHKRTQTPEHSRVGLVAGTNLDARLSLREAFLTHVAGER